MSNPKPVDSTQPRISQTARLNLWPLGLAIWLFAFVAAPSWAQVVVDDVIQQYDPAIRQIAEAFDGEPAQLSNLIRERTGLPTGIKPETWFAMSDYDKIAAWVESAETRTPGIGQKQLRWLAIMRGNDYGGLLNDPAVKAIIDVGGDLPNQVQFSPASPRGPPSGMTAQRYRQFTELAAFDNAPRTLDPISSYRADAQRIGLNLSDTEIRRALVRHGTASEATAHLYRSLPATEVNTHLTTKVGEIAAHYPSIAHQPSLAQFVPDETARPFAQADGVYRNTVRAGARLVPRATVSNAMRKLVTKTYKNVRVPFSKISRGFRGLGGVVFGNRVTADERLVPVGIRYAEGRLVVTTQNGGEVFLSDVDDDIAYAALHIAYGDPADPNPIGKEEGVPIASLIFDETSPFVQRVPDGVQVGKRFEIAAHEALVNSGLAWAAIQVDVIPIAKQYLGSALEHTQDATPEEKRFASHVLPQLFGWLGGEDYLGTWKVVDVPTFIKVEGTELIVERQGVASEGFSTSLRRTAFLEMHRITIKDREALEAAAKSYELALQQYNNAPNDTVRRSLEDKLIDAMEREAKATGYDREYAHLFYRHVPGICEVSDDYAKINNLARVLAVTRWAATNGAVLRGEMPAPQPPERIPGAVAVGTDFVLPVENLTRERATRKQIRMLDNEIEALVVQIEDGRSVAEKMTELHGERDIIMYWSPFNEDNDVDASLKDIEDRLQKLIDNDPKRVQLEELINVRLSIDKYFKSLLED